MKDFIKWLGVNEKIAKVAVWLLIIMVFLIVFNTGLESIGFPHYAITYDNLVKINYNKFAETIVAFAITILNFYTVALLVFRVREAKKILKFSIVYLILNILINKLFGYIVLQVFIIIYILMFCYFYSNKNKKYILYGTLSYIFSVIIQGIWYISKAKFIDYTNINNLTRSILSLDYFIIMALIILVKEIYLKKRGERLCGDHQDASYGSANSKAKTKSQRKSQRKSQAQLTKTKRIK